MAAIDISKDNGLLKTIVKPGKPEDGHPNTGDTVCVHYVGKLKDTGEQFDSSRDRGEPFKFTLGTNQVIKGWDLGVATMQKGEVADLECRADYAYGENGSPPKIPGNATLVFNVELISWEGEDISPDRDGSILKSTIVKGEKYNCPVENSPVTVHAVGIHNGRVFYDRDVKFLLGEGAEQQLPDGVDRALRRIDKGEKCQVVLKNRFTYGTNPPPEFGLPPNAELTFTLFLKDFEKVKASWELLDNEKLEEAQKLKDRGTNFLGQGKLQLALQKYQSVVSLLEHVTNVDEDLSKKFDVMLVAAFLNSALVYLKQNQTSKCIKNCEKALEKDPKNVKALYRKAQALEQRKDYKDAVDEYKRVIEADPVNKAALQQIVICKQKIAEAREKERKRFAGMFDRLRADDAEADEPVAGSSTVLDVAAEPAEV